MTTTAAAEATDDENNLVIIFNPQVAAQYMQEFQLVLHRHNNPDLPDLIESQSVIP